MHGSGLHMPGDVAIPPAFNMLSETQRAQRTRAYRNGALQGLFPLEPLYGVLPAPGLRGQTDARQLGIALRGTR